MSQFLDAATAADDDDNDAKVIAIPRVLSENNRAKNVYFYCMSSVLVKPIRNCITFKFILLVSRRPVHYRKYTCVYNNGEGPMI